MLIKMTKNTKEQLTEEFSSINQRSFNLVRLNSSKNTLNVDKISNSSKLNSLKNINVKIYLITKCSFYIAYFKFNIIESFS